MGAPSSTGSGAKRTPPGRQRRPRSARKGRGRSKATGVEKLLTTPPLTSGTRRAVYRRHRQHPRGQGSSKLDLACATPGDAAGVASIPHVEPNVNGALSTIFQHLLTSQGGGQNGQKKLPASKKIPAFYSGDIYNSNVQLCYTFVYLNCPLNGIIKCPLEALNAKFRFYTIR